MAKRQHARCSNLFCALALAKDNFASFATLDLPVRKRWSCHPRISCMQVLKDPNLV